METPCTCVWRCTTNVSQCFVRHPQHPRPKCSIDFTGMRLLGISQAVKGPVHTDNKRTNMSRSQVSPTCPKVQYGTVLQQTFGEQPRVGHLRAWSFRVGAKIILGDCWKIDWQFQMRRFASPSPASVCTPRLGRYTLWPCWVFLSNHSIAPTPVFK